MRMSTWAKTHYDRLAHDPEYLAAKIMIEVNEQIVERMEELGVSQHELARRLGKTQPFISRLLNHGTNVTIVTLAALADALDAEWKSPCLMGRETIEAFHEVQPVRRVAYAGLPWQSTGISKTIADIEAFKPTSTAAPSEVETDVQQQVAA